MDAQSIVKQLKFDNIQNANTDHSNVQLISKLTSIANSPSMNECHQTDNSLVVKSPYELHMRRVFGSSDKKEEMLNSEDNEPERTPE